MIKHLEQKEGYKYIRFDESNVIQLATTKEKKRVLPESTINPEDRRKLKSNREKNALEIPVITYCFNIVNWTIPIIQTLMLTDFIFPGAREEGD